MIHELLDRGVENALTGSELADYFGCNVRDVTAQIERERREGHPICASTGDTPGYYQAADADDLERYCERLRKRGVEVLKTRKALLKTLRKMRDKAAQNSE